MMNEFIGTGFIVLGLFSSLVGTFSLVRLPDFFSRLQASVRAVAFGAALALFGSFLMSPASSEGFKALMCAVFLFFTSPVVAHAIAKGERAHGKSKTVKARGR